MTLLRPMIIHTFTFS